MKTSKIIFIVFFSVIGLLLLSLLIQNNPEKRGNKEFREIHREVVALPTFSHLIVHDGCNVRIINGISDSLKIGYKKDLVLEHSIYTINGDTLIINQIPDNKGFYTDLTCTKLKSIQTTNSYIIIDQFSFAELNIDGTNSTIDINNNVSILFATIHLTNGSRLWYNNSTLGKVNITLVRSSTEFNIDKITELKAELRDSSELTVGRVLHNDVKTDETSRYYSR
jgi:hypothetical protein